MPGGAPGLQNQCGAEKVPGGFDSHSPPPFFHLETGSRFCYNQTEGQVLQ